VGVVLAGGASRRMGCPKAALRHPSGRTLLAEAVHRLRPWTRLQVVAGRPPGVVTGGALPVVSDPPGLRGPLAGIARAAQVFPAAYYLILAVDLPWARPERLVAAARRQPGRAAVARLPGGQWQPLAGLYPARRARAAMPALRQSGRRVMPWALAEAPLAVDGPWWVNINTPEEAAACLAGAAAGEWS
jgi:molybdopterin-guanine dinucleotide biosynthesis protein A